MLHELVGARRVIVTRPAHDAGDWVQQLQQKGFAAEALPLIEIAAASGAADVQAMARAWQTIDSYTACMFVSGNAVRFFFEQKEGLRQRLSGLIAINNVAKSMPGAVAVHPAFHGARAWHRRRAVGRWRACRANRRPTAGCRPV